MMWNCQHYSEEAYPVNAHIILAIAGLMTLMRFWRTAVAVVLCGIAVVFAIGLAAGLSALVH